MGEVYYPRLSELGGPGFAHTGALGTTTKADHKKHVDIVPSHAIAAA